MIKYYYWCCKIHIFF